jgi:hypothetical protein
MPNVGLFLWITQTIEFSTIVNQLKNESCAQPGILIEEFGYRRNVSLFQQIRDIYYNPVKEHWNLILRNKWQKKRGNQRKYHCVQGFLCQQEIKRGRGKYKIYIKKTT